jgi:hypothetical protein
MFRLQPLQLAHQRIVLGVGDLGLVENVVQTLVPAEFVPKLVYPLCRWPLGCRALCCWPLCCRALCCRALGWRALGWLTWACVHERLL